MFDVFIQSRLGNAFLKLLFKVYEFFRYRRSLYDHTVAQKSLERIFSDLTVKEGLMKGLKYPSFSSFGSSIFPKLSGSYESELYHVIQRLTKKNYSNIVDVGCAEGFYAVGLARLTHNARIYAFDIDPIARDLCKRMAIINAVDNKVIVDAECTPEWFKTMNFAAKTLIISDCEGYEAQLFNSSNISFFKNCDLLIELHPMHVTKVAEHLTNLFEPSHAISLVTSHDDKRKMIDFGKLYPDLNELELLKVVQEGRSYTMDWLILETKS